MSSREQWMQEALSRLLDVDPSKIAPTQSFAEIGVDSLIGLRFARQLQDEFGLELELEWLYDNPSVRELSAFIDERFGAADVTSAKSA